MVKDVTGQYEKSYFKTDIIIGEKAEEWAGDDE